MLARLNELWKDEEAPTAVEYAIMLGAITAVIVAVVWVFGGAVKNMFEDANTKYQSGH
jgi:pilus assembly protein Flp/PilA